MRSAIPAPAGRFARRHTHPVAILLSALVLAASACGDGGGGGAGPTGAKDNDPGFRLTALAGDGQVAPWAGILPESLAVRVTDASGAPIARASVDWAVTSGGGSIAGKANQTGADGVARAQWVLGSALGPQALTVTTIGGRKVTFTATAVNAPRIVFTHPLVPLDKVAYIGALGHVNPPSHTLPSDHIYFYMSDNRRCPCPLPGRHPVTAPATGTIESIERSSSLSVPDDAIQVRASPTVLYYIIHVLLRPDLAVGQRITAGDSLGTTSGMVYAVDLGVVNSQRANPGFARVGRYPPRTVYADAPLSYYEDPLRSRLHALVSREGSDKDGRVDFDEPGKLVGGWFRADMPLGSEGSLDMREMWSRHLYFLPDNEYPSKPAVSIGGTLATGARVYFLDATAPDPRSVTPASGVVAYKLQPRIPAPFSLQAVGTLLVRMVAADTIEVEAFTNDTTARAFTPAAVRYTR